MAPREDIAPKFKKTLFDRRVREELQKLSRSCDIFRRFGSNSLDRPIDSHPSDEILVILIARLLTLEKLSKALNLSPFKL